MLPKLETNIYETTLPSTGKAISFRPYFVKEEKVLLTALETGNLKDITKNILQLIDTCITSDFDVDDLTLYDFEYMFLQLRSKSMGENIEVNVKCSNEECNEVHAFEIPIEDIKFEYPKGEKSNNIVKLNDTVGVTLKHVSAKILQEFSDKDIEEMSMDAAQKIIRSAIVNVFDSDNVWDIKDISTTDLNGFVESMTSGQLKKIQEYISNQPSMIYRHSWKCPKCGKSNDIVLKGLESFLG